MTGILQSVVEPERYDVRGAKTGAGAAHTHHFLASAPFKGLQPGARFTLELDPAGFVRLEPTGGGGSV